MLTKQGDFTQLEKYFNDLDAKSLVEENTRKKRKGNFKQLDNYVSHFDLKSSLEKMNRKKRYSP